MIRGIYTSASGMVGNAQRQRVISNNVANVNTTGYQGQQLGLSPFARSLVQRTGAGSMGQPLDVLNQGMRAHTMTTDREAGQLMATGRLLDWAVLGEGYFAVEMGEGVALTRSGHFHRDTEGYLCTAEGYRLLGSEGPLQIQTDSPEVTPDGRVMEAGEYRGQLALALPEDALLAHRSENGYVLVEDAELVFTDLTQLEDTRLVQGHLEGSNVDLVNQMTRLMVALRQYGANHSALQLQDGALDNFLRMIDG